MISFLSSLVLLLSSVNAYTPVSDDTLRSLSRPGTDFDIHNGAILAPILRPRVPGTPGSTAVLEHFVKFFKTTLPDWRLEFQNSTSKTPVTGDKQIPFVNLIAIRDPPFAHVGDVSRLTLVAHYDSKLTPEGFIGAIDSAAPCAMLLHSVRSIDVALTKRWKTIQANPPDDIDMDAQQGVQVFLLDGEEAFGDWTATDSLYGARSLAEHMEHEYYPALSTFKTSLSAIRLFVLLDLLGSKDPIMPSFFATTHWAYKHMAKLEQRLRKLGQFKSDPDPKKGAEKAWLTEGNRSPEMRFQSHISDDHVPFMQRGVEILHMIPWPFPHELWHKIQDDAEHLDPPTVEDWSTLITAFLAEWMDLEGFFDTKKSKQARIDDEEKTEL
ncbi:glutaminyl-peptide cyclotransferase [Arthroderma uncinatum]|uniref:glutaminyl-peptide cyclotransferase n=1 Tax=Arthroderma uncinatum TaxID=74035 RepID=UPI00144AEC09|nr:glutaminyl-peptide cyclotransferase [Arthroderma uncinatum]KAF3483951.1 glutaminyl-peptide cyclotransferase [Arthroderma uncinatum]